MNTLTAYKKIQKINQKINKVPYRVWVVFYDKKPSILIHNDLISMGDTGDFVGVEQAQDAIEWYAEQLGGKVVWGDEQAEKGE